MELNERAPGGKHSRVLPLDEERNRHRKVGLSQGRRRQEIPRSREGWMSEVGQGYYLQHQASQRAGKKPVPQERFFCLFSSSLTSNKRI